MTTPTMSARSENFSTDPHTDSCELSATEQKSTPHLAAITLEKTYKNAARPVPVLQGVDVSVKRGEFVSIVGQSGSGKSTLLHLLGLLDTPDIGEVRLDGQRIDDLSTKARDAIRNRVFGFIFQFFNLLPVLSAVENVEMPLLLAGTKRQPTLASTHALCPRL